LEVWADRTRQLQEAGLAYVMPFENRGIEMGATLQHPHGLEDARSQLKLLSSLSEDFQDQGVSRPAC
jgi:galactose-1-phosphate uridylyltransferase